MKNQNPLLSVSRRTRGTPFSNVLREKGIKSYTVYNQMLLATVFDSVESDYHHLKTHVQIWDVSCERQIEISGPDARKLIQKLTPRDITKQQPDQCFYIPVVDENGGMLNDPVLTKVGTDRYWISVADLDLLLWVKGLAYAWGMDVIVHEPDVSLLAVQGPKSNTLMERVFGSEVNEIRFFRYKRMRFMDQYFIVARSGYSKQGGFEIYIENEAYAIPLWYALFEAGEDLEVRPGGPNLIERIEGGLLSYGNDMTMENTPYECGLGHFCNEHILDFCVGGEALRAKQNPTQRIESLEIACNEMAPPTKAWPIFSGSERVGQVTSAAWSACANAMLALGMVVTQLDKTRPLHVATPEGPRALIIK